MIALADPIEARLFVNEKLKTPLDTAAELNVMGDGATTVSTATELVTLPKALVTTTA